MERRRVLGMVALGALLLQAASATVVGRRFESPNASTQLARSLVRDGRYAVPGWTILRGPAAIGNDEPLRAYHLPGEPLYLALGFTIVPESVTRYLHVPVTALFITAIAAVALVLGGRRLAIAASLLACADPFVFVHGPVWDDTFLASACEWTIFALFLGRLARSEATTQLPRQRDWVWTMVVAGLAGMAAITRMQAQLLIGVVGLVAVAMPPLKPVRAYGWAVLAGLAIVVSAWGLRNTAVLGSFYVGTTHDGITLFRANYVTARPTILQTGTAEQFGPEQLVPEYAAVAGLGELDADRYFRQQAWKYARAHPADVAATAGLKWAVSLTGLDFAKPLSSWRNVVSVGTNVGLLVTAAFGVLGWRRRFGRTRTASFALFLCAATAIVTGVMLAAGPVGLRYRIDLAGFMYLAAGSVALRVRRASRS